MHTAENDVFGIGLRSKAREFERIASQISVLINISTLIVVTKNDRFFAEFGAGDTNSFLTGLVRHLVERIEGNGCCLHAVL